MKPITFFLLLIFAAPSCQDTDSLSSIDPVNWDKRKADLSGMDSLQSGRTYLSVYSEIYSQDEHQTHDLTATISMRNTSTSDTIYVLKAEYFDTKGQSIRTYFNQPIFLAPLETVEIVIDELDRSGGSGANFIFDWQKEKQTYEPIFEAVMISTYGQQGISFVTQGKTIATE